MPGVLKSGGEGRKVLVKTCGFLMETKLIISQDEAQKLARDYQKGLERTRGLPTLIVRHEKLPIDCEVVPVNALIEHLGLWDEAERKLKLPCYWSLAHVQADGAMFVYEPRFGRRLKVSISACREQDGRLWMHLSVSSWNQTWKEQSIPDWVRLKLAKDVFIGPEREAYQVLPRAADYVNIGEVLHLFCCLEGRALPDFTNGMRSI